MKKTKKLLALLLALCMIVALCACGAQTPAETAAEDSAAETETDASDLSNTLVYAGENEDTINPVLTNHDEITDIVFSGLMKFDKNGEPVEDLAKSYEYDEDAMTYTFKLRENVKWHDGEDFTADDVVFTYEALTGDETLSSSLRSDYERRSEHNFLQPGTSRNRKI